MMTLRQKLNHAVIDYDCKQMEKAAKSKRGYYNHYALGIYLGRVDDCIKDIEAGANIGTVLRSGFNDRLLSVVLKAADIKES